MFMQPFLLFQLRLRRLLTGEVLQRCGICRPDRIQEPLHQLIPLNPFDEFLLRHHHATADAQCWKILFVHQVRMHWMARYRVFLQRGLS